MQKQVVSYEGFRFSKLNDPRFSHLKLLFAWPPFLALFIITGRLYPPSECSVMYMFLDDLIPFCEWFVIPYVLWYAMIAYTLIYFLRHDIPSFKRLQTFILSAQIISTLIFIFLPTCHELRPLSFPRDNLLTDAVKLIYSLDTTCNACPSIHVTYSIAITVAWLRCRQADVLRKSFMTVLAVLVCLSTVFIKQHSAVDFFGALPLCAVCWLLVYVIYRRKAEVKPQ